MRHGLSNIGQSTEINKNHSKGKEPHFEDFVLEKSIFNNIFEKDIRRVFIYKKAERLAKAVHLIAPAFAESASLRSRVDAIAIGLVDAAVLPSGAGRTALSRELLSLSTMLSIARTGGLLSLMNVDLITHEAHTLLQEVAAYEEPRLFLDEVSTLSDIAKKARSQSSTQSSESGHPNRVAPAPRNTQKMPIKDKAPISDSGAVKDRREAIMSVIRNKQKASIKDISTLIRGVSEKTIQRELFSLIESGIVLKQGERRWSTYSLS